MFTTWVTAIATAIVALATIVYAWLVYRQLRLGKPNVFPYVATRSGRPYVNVINSGATTAYRVSVKIDWPEPPDPIQGEPETVESPEFGQLMTGEKISFESPHEIVAKDHFVDSTDYCVKVAIEYDAIGGSRSRPKPFMLNFTHYMKKMAQSRMKH